MTTEFDGLEEFALLLSGTLGESFSFFMDWHLWNWGQNVKAGSTGHLSFIPHSEGLVPAVLYAGRAI